MPYPPWSLGSGSGAGQATRGRLSFGTLGFFALNLGIASAGFITLLFVRPHLRHSSQPNAALVHSYISRLFSLLCCASTIGESTLNKKENTSKHALDDERERSVVSTAGGNGTRGSRGSQTSFGSGCNSRKSSNSSNLRMDTDEPYRNYCGIKLFWSAVLLTFVSAVGTISPPGEYSRQRRNKLSQTKYSRGSLPLHHARRNEML